MKNPKALLATVVLPAALGLLCASFYPQAQALPATPEPARPITSSATLAPAEPKAPSQTTPAQSALKLPEDPSERISELARNYRIEDLLEELEQFPPGEERNPAIEKLTKRWFDLDPTGTTAWIAALNDDTEKEAAYAGMVEAWTHHDSAAASAWVAALPDGRLKWKTGLGLAESLGVWDPASSLRWAIASRKAANEDSNFESVTRALAYDNYTEAQRIVNESDLTADEKHRLLRAAKIGQNQKSAIRGEWERILPMEPTAP